MIAKKYGKMMHNLLIISLCFVAINAHGEFSVLSSPKSLSFKGSDVLQSQDVGEVLYTSMGNPVSGDAQWSGLIINDPFNLPKGIVAVLVEGVDHISVNSNAKTFEVAGDNSHESLNGVTTELEANNVPVCDIDFSDFDEALVAYRSCFGDVPTLPSNEAKSLNPSLYAGDKQFLQAIELVNYAANNLATMKKASNFVVLRISLESIAKIHGEKSEAMTEATKMVSTAITNLNSSAQKSSNKGALVVAIANKSVSGRTKREVVAPNSENPYNLAEYYNQDYPVVFNIILWFMVVFGLSLLAICYAIGSMDPGRDSIIYRMTSTRMKKDN